jgi:threonine aldolase
MIRFESDYLEGALPEIIERLVSTNTEQTPDTEKSLLHACGRTDQNCAKRRTQRCFFS